MKEMEINEEKKNTEALKQRTDHINFFQDNMTYQHFSYSAETNSDTERSIYKLFRDLLTTH